MVVGPFFSVDTVELCVSEYLDVVTVTVGLHLEGNKGVVDGVSTAGLDGPAALGVVWVVVGKVQ